MCDDRELAVGFLDLELSCICLHAERIIVSMVPLSVCHFLLKLRRTYVVSATIMPVLTDALGNEKLHRNKMVSEGSNSHNMLNQVRDDSMSKGK